MIMGVFDHARIIIYRINKKGLEIFLVESENDKEGQWEIPNGLNLEDLSNDDRCIELEGTQNRVIAVEGDWHDIPSIRKMIKDDVKIVKKEIKKEIKKRVPILEKGRYVAVKETIKKVLPEEYKMIKELKDIVVEQNLVRNI